MATRQGKCRERLSLVLALAAFVSAWTASGWSQCKESDFPGSEGVIAAPTRPIESSSPDPVQVGVFQIEMGWQHTWVTQAARNDAFVNLVKLGVWCGIEVAWSGNSFLRSANENGVASGVGDNYVTSQYRLLREQKRFPSVGLAYVIKSPTASLSKGLGSEEIDQAASLLIGKSLHSFYNVWNATYFSVGQSSGGAQGKGEWTWALSHSITRRFAVTAEIYADTKLNRDNDAYANTTWVLNYIRRGWLVFDVGTSVPLTSGPGAPGNAVFGGVTYAVADLYRRHRQ